MEVDVTSQAVFVSITFLNWASLAGVNSINFLDLFGFSGVYEF
jgi:hypothetical protein